MLFYFLDKDLESVLREAFQYGLELERDYKETIQDDRKLPNHNELALTTALLGSQERTPDIGSWSDSIFQTIRPYRKHILHRLITHKPDASTWATKYTIVSFDG